MCLHAAVGLCARPLSWRRIHQRQRETGTAGSDREEQAPRSSIPGATLRWCSFIKAKNALQSFIIPFPIQ